MNNRQAAREMRALPEAVRTAAIKASANVLDGRDRFLHRRKQAEIARTYRRPPRPTGRA